jgi:hypothetical protein
VLRHRHQALSRHDYESLACEASPAVALARALPATTPSGLPLAGWVKLIIVPHGQEARPFPSYELRRRVSAYLGARMPAAMGGLSVVGPEYLPVAVEAGVVPRHGDEAGLVRERVLLDLATFFHPLHGGPSGKGWPFGRGVWLSDVAARLEGVEGVDYIATLNLLLDGTPRGETVAVPADRIVVAGPHAVTLASGGA